MSYLKKISKNDANVLHCDFISNNLPAKSSCVLDLLNKIDIGDLENKKLQSDITKAKIHAKKLLNILNEIDYQIYRTF